MKIATSDEIRAIAGVDTRKCMKCGKCSASCPAYNEMDIRPHQLYLTYRTAMWKH
ncbi:MULTISPECIES: 4Fe-4S dicluster domain-containing protein [unclassified Blautia]|uniref:4Fe-4S dicluster domain-containing protein n=1 Tax=unclassified Blautia TaxID=2648079 RepID=UPI0026BE70F1|nr:4Fe-4S dicluster domain-containing protein [Blautia sp. AM47-4]